MRRISVSFAKIPLERWFPPFAPTLRGRSCASTLALCTAESFDSLTLWERMCCSWNTQESKSCSAGHFDEALGWHLQTCKRLLRPCNRSNLPIVTLSCIFVMDKEMLTLPEGRPQQAARFGVQHEEVARKAYVAWRREAMILGTGGSRIIVLGGCGGYMKADGSNSHIIFVC